MHTYIYLVYKYKWLEYQLFKYNIITEYGILVKIIYV